MTISPSDDEKLIEALRNWTSPFKCHHGAVYELADKAAARLSALTAENAEYRQSLDKLGEAYDLLLERNVELRNDLDRHTAENARLRKTLGKFKSAAEIYNDLPDDSDKLLAALLVSEGLTEARAALQKDTPDD